MKLTVGMATFDDFEGVYFTVQALRLQHRDVLLAGGVELVVVDNNPRGRHAPLLRDFLGWVKGDFAQARYVPFDAVQGTAAPREMVFHAAAGEAVLCLDSHVLLWPGSLRALLAHYEANPGTRDLLSGPMLYDDLKNFSTHFNDEWRGEMWGTWGTDMRGDGDAWRCPCGKTVFRVTPSAAKPLAHFVNLAGAGDRPAFKDCGPRGGLVCGCEAPRPEHGKHAEALLAAGFVRADAPPFEIGAMGLGAFSCRKEAWLGFNPNFRGFGGEEWYVHTKFRQAGARCLCLPAFRWLHRFARPAGVAYPLTRFHKCRNYVIGHKELGLDLTPVYAHFVTTGLVSAEEWEAILAGAESPPAAAAGCVPCGKAAAAQPASLEAAYAAAAGTPSDINEHVPTLRELASKCEHVTEMGVRTGVSTVGLLAGQPKQLVSYDLNDSPQARALGAVAGKTAFRFERGDSTAVDIEQTDLLFIDTRHTADHLYAELSRHAPQVRHYIALHDTVVYGERGEDGGPGLLPAVRRFLGERPEWTVVRHDRNNHGLLVISKDPADKKALPALWQQGWNVLKASWRAGANVTKDYGPLAGTDAQERRLSLCTLCPSRTEGRCAECGCPVDKKTSWPAEACPLGQWGAEEGKGAA